MAVNQTLLSLLEDFRYEVSQSDNPAHNSQVRNGQVYAIRKAQEVLWGKHDWPHLRVQRFIDLQAGQRYYDPRGAFTLDLNGDPVPAIDLGIERLECIEVRWGSEWCALTPGITDRDYNTWDSDLDVRSWPAERWEIFEGQMFEIWPIPADNADPISLDGRLRLTGIRDLRPLVADDDRADLDDGLIVKFAAAKPLARAGAKNAQLVLDEAKTIEADLTANFSKTKSFSLAGVPMRRVRTLHGPPRVHYRVNE